MKANLIILDGDRWQREALASALACEGWHAEHTGNAASAMALLGRHRFQLMLLNPSTQSTGGWATIERLVLLHPDLPVIVLAPSHDKEQAQSVLLTGANGGVGKFIDFAALVSAIERAICTPAETFVVRCIKREQPRAAMLPSFIATGSFASNPLNL